MILLGYGVFSINGKDIALTKGGGKFVVERDYQEIEADGDFGPVKDRVVLKKSVAKLSLKQLTLVAADMDEYYPGITVTDEETKTTVTGNATVSTGDYYTAKWTGKTKDGKAVVITIDNAINLENLEWELVDKEEVIQELNYTATYLEADRDAEPWKVEFTK